MRNGWLTLVREDAIVARTRQLIVFDRFLARIAAVFGDAATLKGGVALELRIERARTTKDVDLRLVGSPDDLLAQLQRVARHDLGDFMTFEIAPDAEHPEIEAEGMKYDGVRFRAECRLAGKLYGQRFGVDVAFGDPMFGDADLLVADDPTPARDQAQASQRPRTWTSTSRRLIARGALTADNGSCIAGKHCIAPQPVHTKCGCAVASCASRTSANRHT